MLLRHSYSVSFHFLFLFHSLFVVIWFGLFSCVIVPGTSLALPFDSFAILFFFCLSL